MYTISNVYDFKINNEWVRSYSKDGIHYKTRSAIVWNGIISRTNPNGKAYRNSINGFSDYQKFANWCNKQYGYMNKDCDRFWSIDKDIIIPGNKIYSESSCLFVPNFVNSFFSYPKNGCLPIGVYLDSGKYKATCCDLTGKQVTLGRYLDKMEAHSAWQKFKLEKLHEICRRQEVVEHRDLQNALQNRIVILSDEISKNLETKY